MASWQIQKAKTRLSELLEEANTKGPQIITRHGTPRAFVVSPEDYGKLSAHKLEQVEPNFIEFLLSGPQLEDDDPFFEIMRNIRDPNDTGREIDL
jgi:antitoxin Phd